MEINVQTEQSIQIIDINGEVDGNTAPQVQTQIMYAHESYAAAWWHPCLLYTSDAADDLLCVDLGGRRIIKKKNTIITTRTHQT